MGRSPRTWFIRCVGAVDVPFVPPGRPGRCIVPQHLPPDGDNIGGDDNSALLPAQFQHASTPNTIAHPPRPHCQAVVAIPEDPPVDEHENNGHELDEEYGSG